MTLVLLCSGLGIAGFWVAALDGSFSGADGGGASSLSPLSLNGSLSPSSQAWVDDGLGVVAARAAQLANPEAVLAREASRTANEHLGSRAAVRLAQRTFPTLVMQPAAESPRLPTGGRIVRYLSPTSAAVALPGKHSAVIESAGPIARRSSSGAFVPLDLGLANAGNAYVTRGSDLPLRIPKSLPEGLRLPTEDISLTPIDGEHKPLSGSQGAIAGASVLYANTQQDTDTLVKPTADGFELNSMLRSANSPTKLLFRIGMPAGARLVDLTAGDGARVVEQGRTLATIAAPAALDAAGSPVALSTKIAGDIMELDVRPPAIGSQYPIAVDPYVLDKQLTGEVHGAIASRWKFCASDDIKCEGYFSAKFKSEGWASFVGISLEAIGGYSTNQWVSLNYQTQGESKIFEVSGSASGSNPSGNVDSYAQLVNGKGTANESEWSIEDSNTLTLPPTTSYSNASIGVCPKLLNGERNCNEGAGASKNLFRFEQSMAGNGSSLSNTLNNATVFISQANNPTVKFNTATPTIEGRANVLYGSGAWLGPHSGAYEIEAKDPGIGISFLSVSSGLWGVAHPFFEEGLCEGVQCSPEVKEHYTYDEKQKDGEDLFELHASNATVGSSSSTTAKIKVDGTSPTNINLIGLPGSKELSEQPYTITAEAADGSGTVESSGVKSIAVGIDGAEVTPKIAAACSPGPCVAKGEWVISAEGLGAGEHELTVVATDNAGNVSTRTYQFNARHATPTSAGPGSLDPITGQLSLSATDATVGYAGGNLGVSRTYNSRQASAGAEGPLGPQWTMNTGPVEKVEKLPSGDAVLVGADGGLTSFASNGSGGFTSPVGDKNLTMSEVKEGVNTKEFVLTDSTARAKTNFALPEGATTGPWFPSRAEGPVAAATDTYKFKTIEVAGKKITEPVQILAPVPSGGSCAPTLKKGCRALTFNYATSTTATGESPAGWGDYNGRLTRVYFTAWDSKSASLATVEIAQYAYDAQGRLRAEWDPRISPALKTIYGYDVEGHVTALSSPGQQPWLLSYGTNAGDTTSGRLVSITRPPASTAFGEDVAPANTAVPKLSSSSAVLGKQMTVTVGEWSNAPLAYSYQWERCQAGGAKCAPIFGARNQGYTPVAADSGYTLEAQVTAVNAGGSTTASTAASEAVSAVAPTYAFLFGSSGIGNGQFKTATSAAVDPNGNVWITDFANNRIQEFSPTGSFIAAYGTEGSGNVQFKGPWGVVADHSGNIYVSDSNNCRIEELSSAGAFVRAFGSCGSGRGQLSSPEGLSLDSSGNLWVVDSGNSRVEAFTPTGEYMMTVGSAGTGSGQLKSPRSMAFVGSNFFVTDAGNQRVLEFSMSGAYVAQFGSFGTGNGQFNEPYGIAVDPLSGELYVSDRGNHRVQRFTESGTYVSQFGTAGSEAGKLRYPEGLAMTSGGEIYTVEAGNSRVDEWWPTPSFAYGQAFGSLGSGNGQLSKPIDSAVDPMGNVWVTDSSNNRIEKFSPYGAFLGAYGSFGTGHGQFNSPGGIAINQSTGNVYVSDQKNGRVEEFSPSGQYLAEFGKPGVGSGEFSNPYGLAIDSNGNIWVVDLSNGRVQEFSQSGTTFAVVRIVGKKGVGNGEFTEPRYAAFDGGNLYVTDSGNNRVEEFSSTGTYLAQFGSKGTGNGQFEDPEGIAVDPQTGALYVADTGKNRIESFSATGAFLAAYGSLGTSEGQFKSPVGLTFSSAGTLYTTDYGNNRIVKTSAGDVHGEPPAPPTPGTTAVTSIVYNVPIHGAGAPYAMGESEVSAWAQEDDPAEATAIFPPDEPQTTPASDYRRAVVLYLDEFGHTVNVATPGAAIVTTEYDGNNGVVRTLTAANRVAALAQGSKSKEVSEHLDSQTVYSSEDAKITETLGPEHAVKLSSGSEVQARERMRFFYDEGAPEGGPYGLVTKTTSGALYSGGEADVRTTIKSYSGQNNLGWQLRKPTSVTTDPAGLKLTSTTIYDPTTGNVTETRSPGAGSANGPSGNYAYAAQITTTQTSTREPAGVAVDSNGNVWQVETGKNRVDEYTSTGEIVTTFGSEGASEGQLKKPQGIALDANGNVWVTDTGNNRVEEFSSTGTFVQAFGTAGELEGQLKEPTGIAFDSTGNVWIADRGNNRVEEFSTFGTFQRAVGKYGTGNGQFTTYAFGSQYPMWLTFDSGGHHLWVTDGGDNRVEEFSSEGTYMTKFGSSGSENGNFSWPAGIAHDASGNLWVVDTGNDRVQEFSSAGVYMSKFGAMGTGNGQFNAPSGIALDSSGNIWVGDTGNNRLEQVTSAGAWVRNAAAAITSLNAPAGIAVDSSGNVWHVEKAANRVDEYTSSGQYVRAFGSEGTANGQFKAPQGIAIDANGNIWVTDTGNNRVQEFSSTGGFITAFGTVGAAEGQLKEPMGIAIDSSKNVWVADRGNNRIERFSATGVFQLSVGKVGFGNGEFIANYSGKLYPMWLTIDSAGHLWVADGGNNRVQEFSSAGAYMAKFGGEYAKESTENGKFSAPAGIAHDGNGNLWVVDSGNSRVEEFSSTGTYLSKFGEKGPGLGQLQGPSGVALDSSANIWIGDTGNNRSEQFSYASVGPRITQLVYYSALLNSTYPECGEHLEWVGMVCRTQPAAQPAPSAAPELPVTTVTYNMWDGMESVVEKVGTTTRTKKSTFDSAGRLTTSSVTSSAGAAVPTVTDEYSTTTGTLVRQSTTVGETTQSISSVYNSLGQRISYTDADGNAATYKYNLDGQTEEASDGKGTQSYTYDATTGALTRLVDTAAGTFTAARDVAGRPIEETYPNGMVAKYTYDASGNATSLEYVKTTNCTEKCTWYSQNLTLGIYGEMMSQVNAFASVSYTYDATGRLTQTDETPTGGGCKRRIYEYDVESNRISSTMREPGTEGKCATTGGIVENHAYDEANRLIDSGTAYEPLGNITSLPAADAGGQTVTSSYYTSGQLQSQTQNGLTLTYYLDPAGRIRETVGSGTKTSDTISHYASDGSAAAWTSETGEKWSRNITGVDGQLVAVQSNGETPILQLRDLQDDIVGTAAESSTETKLLSTYNSTEFGVPTTSSPPKYSWGGASGTATEMASGISNSDTTSYVPQLGRPLQTEPITPPGEFANGSDTGTPYVSGMEPWVGASDAAWGAGAADREAARQQAATYQAALQASLAAEDPTEYYAYVQAPEMLEKAKKIDKFLKANDIADALSLLGLGSLGDIPGAIIVGALEARMQDWLADVGVKLRRCANDMFGTFLPNHERRYCKMKYGTIVIDKYGTFDFFHHVSMGYCIAYTGRNRRHGRCWGVHGNPPVLWA